MIKTCLIAEHDPWDIQLLRLYAERLGFQVVQVFEAQDVLPIARQTRPDVIILEAELPGYAKCHEVICALKADPVSYASAVVVFSRPKEYDLSSEAGMEIVYLTKPATLEGFQSALERTGVWSASESS